MRQHSFDPYTVCSFISKSAGATHCTTKIKCSSSRTIWVWIKIVSMLEKPLKENPYSLICLFINIECICISMPIQSPYVCEWAFKAAFHGFAQCVVCVLRIHWHNADQLNILYHRGIHGHTAACAYAFPNERETETISLSYAKHRRFKS